jgi:hypothetical protein
MECNALERDALVCYAALSDFSLIQIRTERSPLVLPVVEKMDYASAFGCQLMCLSGSLNILLLIFFGCNQCGAGTNTAFPTLLLEAAEGLDTK